MKTLPALGIAFIVLRLCEVIAWSWWWVFAPFWVSWVFPVFLICIGFAGTCRDARGKIITRVLSKFR